MAVLSVARCPSRSLWQISLSRGVQMAAVTVRKDALSRANVSLEVTSVRCSIASPRRGMMLVRRNFLFAPCRTRPCSQHPSSARRGRGGAQHKLTMGAAHLHPLQDYDYTLLVFSLSDVPGAVSNTNQQQGERASARCERPLLLSTEPRQSPL